VSVLVEPLSQGPEPGSPETILGGMSQPPHLQSEDVDERERGIEAARLPVRGGGIFDDAEQAMVYLLDTTTFSDLMREDAQTRARLTDLSSAELTVENRSA